LSAAFVIGQVVFSVEDDFLHGPIVFAIPPLEEPKSGVGAFPAGQPASREAFRPFGFRACDGSGKCDENLVALFSCVPAF
jgi:hypothetical protein